MLLLHLHNVSYANNWKLFTQEGGGDSIVFEYLAATDSSLPV